MPKDRSPSPVACAICGHVLSRAGDMQRHMKTHAKNKEQNQIPCPYPPCPFKALQKSNLSDHINTHTGEKPHKCRAKGCSFATSHSGSLTKHRQRYHGHQSKKKSSLTSGLSCSSGPSSPSSSVPHAPVEHAPPLNSGLSTASEEPSTACPQLPAPGQRFHHFHSWSNNWQYGEASLSPPMVSSSVAPTPTAPVEYVPLNSGILTASEEPAAAQRHLPVREQGGPFTVGTAVQPVRQMCVSEEFVAQLDRWESVESPLSAPMTMVSSSVDVPHPATLPQDKGQYLVDNVPALATHPPYERQYLISSATIFPTLPSYEDQYTLYGSPISTPPAVLAPAFPPYEEQYLIDNVTTPPTLSPCENQYTLYGSPISTPPAVPTPATLPPYERQYLIDNVTTLPTRPPYEDQYTLDGSPISGPAALPLYPENALISTPAPHFSYGAASVNAAYEYYNPTADSTSFDATSTFSQPGLFATPDMGVYPQAFYPRDVDQSTLHNTHAGTSGSAMGGLYVN